MAGMREDYLLRLIDELRQFVAQAIRLREAERLDEALMAVVAAQEKLFARPFSAVGSRPIADQIQLLLEGESPETGRLKVQTYASLLREAGRVYQARNQDDYAFSSFELALHVLLALAIQPGPREEGLTAAVRELAALVPPERRHAPTAEMLAQFEA